MQQSTVAAGASFRPGLELEMVYRFSIRGPLDGAGSPLGKRQYWEMSEGTLEGPRIRAKIAMPGGDWFIGGPDGFGRPNVRAQFVTDDGAFVLLHYTGLVEQTDAFMTASERGGSTDWSDQYMRMLMTFETGDPRYSWLNRNLFVAAGRLTGPCALEYMIYRLT